MMDAVGYLRVSKRPLRSSGCPVESEAKRKRIRSSCCRNKNPGGKFACAIEANLEVLWWPSERPADGSSCWWDRYAECPIASGLPSRPAEPSSCHLQWPNPVSFDSAGCIPLPLVAIQLPESRCQRQQMDCWPNWLPPMICPIKWSSAIFTLDNTNRCYGYRSFGYGWLPWQHPVLVYSTVYRSEVWTFISNIRTSKIPMVWMILNVVFRW